MLVGTAVCNQGGAPYPQDKSECGKIAKQELAGNEHFSGGGFSRYSQYDTIFIGYPVWYGTTWSCVLFEG
ncbi:MAG: hypothetical protein ACLRXQ_05945 [Phascolarctobacterium faecium]